MAFSFRNLFKKDEDNPGGEGGQQTGTNPLDVFGRTPSTGEPDPSAASSPFFDPSQTSPQHASALPINVPAAQILPHIPRELANPNGLAPDAVVRLPAAGASGGLRLTEVYQACPALFSYAPDVRDSREIFVGLPAVSSTAESVQSPFVAHSQSPPQHQSTSFAGQDQSSPPPPTSPFSPAVAEEAPPGQSPAWQSVSPFETSSLDQDQQPRPFETGSLPPAKPAAFETGFLNQSPTAGVETGSLSSPDSPQAEPENPGGENPGFFHSPAAPAEVPPARPVTQELEASALPFAPAPPEELPEESGDIELSLLNVLRAIPQEDLGFDPEEVPTDVRVQLPLSLVRPQLSSGSVTVPLNEIIAGCDERYHPAFVNSREGTQVPLPLQEIFHNLPGDIPEAPSTAEFVARQQAEGAPIFDPMAPDQAEAQSQPAEQQSGQQWQNQPYAAPEFAPTPAASTQEEIVGKPAESAALSPHLFTSAQPQTGLSSEQLLGSPFSVQQPAPEASSEAPPAPFPPVETPDPTPATPQPQPEIAATADQPDNAGDDFADFDQQTDLDQLALRAIFQVEHRLTAQGVLDLCCGLPGVGACVALHPGGALTAETSSGAQFGEDAAGMFQSVAGLARGLGIGEADTFTIRTRKGTFSFFSQGDLCLGVLHDSGHSSFGPGTREKLVLVARELGSMISG